MEQGKENGSGGEVGRGRARSEGEGRSRGEPLMRPGVRRLPGQSGKTRRGRINSWQYMRVHVIAFKVAADLIKDSMEEVEVRGEDEDDNEEEET